MNILSNRSFLKIIIYNKASIPPIILEREAIV